ncbi:VapE domain-containing protein [Ralstonia sp.]|uniref:phage NrS-1 polymerase family protein n=1 Tax=Ralstonia sp. TaxID=54061 RepID=UPI00257D789A|nr:VapE domain-containing protein [Ralstonia sp.]MBA4203218.1 hypothetical protein [Ralstonia sp.]
MTHPLAPLAAYRQFIVVKLIPLPSGKTDKIPVSPLGEVGVDAHAPANWQSWIEADAVARAWGPQYTVGFVLTRNDPFWCLDIDDCRLPDGAWSPLALQICAALPGAVVELSQSGRGLHLWLQHAEHFEHSKKNVPLGIELYSEARFIALGSGHTGALAPDCPAIRDVAAKLFPPRLASGAELPDEGPCAEWLGPTDDDELIRRALASTSSAGVFGGKATFADLWNGNADALDRSYPSADGGYDASSADAALAQHLAFWTGKDAARIERLMRRSALVRSKWDDRDDYLGPRTILGACGQCRQVYRDPRLAAPAPAPASDASAPAAAAPGGVAVADPAPAVSLMAAAANQYKPTLQSVQQAVREVGLWVAHDEFSGRKVMRERGAESPRLLEPVDQIRLRLQFGMGGFNPVKAETMRDVLELEAESNRYDAGIQWGQALTWDGVPRIDRFCCTYWGTADTPYTRAVGAYIWTGLAGRLMSPGCKADMAPILVGGQGVRKSTAIKALAWSPEHFVEIDLDRDEADLGRMMRGKTVCELPELRGMSRKDLRAMKSFVARAIDEWVTKYQEDTSRHPRRCLMFGTTNERDFLNDPTGERRYLPLDAGRIDIAAIERDREQLWAEGIARFAAGGVEWQQAEELAKAVHAAYSVSDPLEEPIEQYLAANPGPARMADIFMAVLKRPLVGAPAADQRQVASVLRKLGRENRDLWVNGQNVKAWVARSAPQPPGAASAP